MTIIIEDGTGVATAESYLSVADADSYHAARGHLDWDALDTEDKEIYLRQATDYLTQAYRLRWKGYRTHSTQALDWPRANVQLPDVSFTYAGYGAYVPFNQVPTEVQRACAELALKAVDGPLAPDIERSVSREVVGPIDITYDPAAPLVTRFRAIDLLLAPLLAGSSNTLQLVRT
jgi:hypothetical protein